MTETAQLDRLRAALELLSYRTTKALQDYRVRATIRVAVPSLFPWLMVVPSAFVVLMLARRSSPSPGEPLDVNSVIAATLLVALAWPAGIVFANWRKPVGHEEALDTASDLLELDDRLEKAAQAAWPGPDREPDSDAVAAALPEVESALERDLRFPELEPMRLGWRPLFALAAAALIALGASL